MKTIIDTSRYYNSYLVQPRGEGWWMFEDANGNVVTSTIGTYAEAKKVAQQSGAALLYTSA